MADDYYRFLEATHMLRGENTQKVYRLGDKVRVQVVRVDMERRQIDLGLVEILDARARGRAPARAAAQQGAAEGGSARAKQRPGQARARHAEGTCGRAGSDDEQPSMKSRRRRHRRPHRSRQERARAGADRHRSRPAEGREGARHHHRPRLRALRRSATCTSPSSTCPATSASSRTCSPASAASTSCCWSSPPTNR